MFENIMKFLKNLGKKEKNKESSDTAKERLHLVLMQDRANVSADFLELMRQEIIEVIKKYIDIDEKAIDVRLTNKTNDDGTVGAPALYANIPIVTIKNEARIANVHHEKKEESKSTNGIERVESKNDKDENKEENKIEHVDNSKQEIKSEKDNEEVEADAINSSDTIKEVVENDEVDKKESDQAEKVLEDAEKIQNEIEKEKEESELEGIKVQQEEQNVSENDEN